MEKSESSKNLHHKSKRPFLGLLSKRSSRVEPQKFGDSETENDPENKDESPNHSSLNINNNTTTSSQQYQSDNINLLSSNEPSTSKVSPKTYNIRNSNKNLNNRFSGQFNLCCSVDENTIKSPVKVTFSNSFDNDVQTRKQNLRLDLTKSAVRTYHIEKLSPTNGTLNRPLEFGNSSSSQSSSVESKIVTKPVVFREYHNHTQRAISTSKSRFRDKFLPPLRALEGYEKIEHYSSPNIVDNDSSSDRRDSRKSMSFETFGDIESRLIQPASTDSLARQALMAAHVLNLIPAEKARQRNFLQGRLATTSLLGAAELDKMLPTREITIFIGTWNMNGQSPPKEMNDFVLPNGIDHVPDIIVFGTQESCSERFEWEVNLQETLGPSHILLHSTSLGTLHLAVFLRRDLIWFCSVPEDANLSVRPGTAFRTKGAVAISFCLFGTSMLFVTSHLTAHQQKVKERVSDVKKIIHALDLPRNLTVKHRNKDVTQNFDSVFWCGDLNFRLSEPRDNLLKWIETTQFPLPAHLPHGFLHTDQLTSVLSDGAAFKGFKEAHITFPPTYKYDPGTQRFDTSSKQRAPAYTDRILYKYKASPITTLNRRFSMVQLTKAQIPPSPVKCIAYDSVQSITTSDHKPVWALFRNVIRPGVDTIPLAAGLFNREVYLEGMKRRLDNTGAGSSAVCNIQ